MGIVKGLLRLILGLTIWLSIFAIHEYGHFREFQKKAIPIKEFSLGIGWKVYQYEYSGVKFTLRAIPIMSYVAPTDEGSKIVEEKLTLRDKVIIYAAGVRNNLAVALVLLFSLQFLGWWKNNLSLKEFALTALLTPVKIVLWFFAFLIGCVTFGLVKLSHKFCLSTGGIDPPKRLKKFVVWNLLFGVFNFVPILPLDGGRIAGDVLASLFADTTMYGLVVKSESPYLAIALLVIFILLNITAFRQDYRILEIDLEDE